MDSKQARQAAQVLREIAPTKSHEIRRACIAAADKLDDAATKYVLVHDFDFAARDEHGSPIQIGEDADARSQ